MSHQEADGSADPKRRAFLAKAGQHALAAPGATLLLAAATKRSMAASYNPPTGSGANSNGYSNGNEQNNCNGPGYGSGGGRR